MKKPRKVTIEETSYGFFVRIANRSKWQRWMAGQFSYHKSDGTIRTRQDVRDWVASQPHLTLIEDEKA